MACAYFYNNTMIKFQWEQHQTSVEYVLWVKNCMCDGPLPQQLIGCAISRSLLHRNASGSRSAVCWDGEDMVGNISLTHTIILAVAERCGNNFKRVIFKYMSWIMFMNTSCKIALRWMPQNTFDDKSIWVQVMAGCYQAPSHNWSQC